MMMTSLRLYGLVLLLLLLLGANDCDAFIIPSPPSSLAGENVNFVKKRFASFSSTTSRSSTSTFMSGGGDGGSTTVVVDPYELQYRQYASSSSSDPTSSNDLLVLDAPTIIETSNSNNGQIGGANTETMNVVVNNNTPQTTSQQKRSNYKPFGEPQWINRRDNYSSSTPSAVIEQQTSIQGEESEQQQQEQQQYRIATTDEEYYQRYQRHFGAPRIIETTAEDISPSSSSSSQGVPNSPETTIHQSSSSSSSPVEGQQQWIQSNPNESVNGQASDIMGVTILDDNNNDNNIDIAQNPTTTTYFPPPSAATDNTVNMETMTSQSEQIIIDNEEEEDMEEKYLQMINNEFAYKKFLGENPYALTDLPFDIIMGRLLDGWEDNYMADKNKRGVSLADNNDYLSNDEDKRPTVVVLGSGWGSHSFVKHVSMLDVKVIVVSPVNHFVFTPMLASAAVGTVEFRSMTEPVRVTDPNVENYVEGRAIGIDVENRRVTVRLTSEGVASSGKINQYSDDSGNVLELDYDHLICAVGTKERRSMIPGAEEHCFPLKTAQDSKRLRVAVQEALENACRADVEGLGYELAELKRFRRSSFVIIGGGPTGVEFAGELNDFLKDVCKPRKGPYQRLANDFSITLVHGGDDLLPQFDEPLRKRALRALTDRGVNVRLNTRLTQVGKKAVTLRRKGDDEEETIPAGVTIWAAGNEPVPFVKELLSQLPETAVGTAGRIAVDRWLRAPTHTPESFGSLFVLGDAADYPERENEPESSLPQTAQVAGQQGAYMARMLNRGYDLKQTPPQLPDTDEYSPLRIWLAVRGLEEAPDFVFLNLGLLAYVGGGEALTQVQAGNVPIVGLGGKRAFALWRSVYLAKQASMRNRSQLIFDWAKSQSSGRDLTRL